MLPGKPQSIPPVVGNINGIALSTEPGPQSLGKPPFIFNKQDPHAAKMPQEAQPAWRTGTGHPEKPRERHRGGSGGLGPPGETG
ncbi:hypothetical protein SAMN05421837_103506 [Amycolatopsis pretoriensis]|uniref:Uncharacterized protein n=1 Tax=Amycolatopsis pretoriensis TaxID=218821 RepID=A0A1H5QKY5_9PSEU|nr:hypothetical protein SAMN05421837_103506 [Amycolatopsis pretoriensis]